MVRDREAWCAAVHGVAWILHNFATEQHNNNYLLPWHYLSPLYWLLFRPPICILTFINSIHREHPIITMTSSLPISFILSSVQFSCSVMSDSLRHHELQHTRPPCPSPTPGTYPNSRPLSQWCQPLSSPFPPVPNPSQDQGLFKWVSSSHQVAKVLEFQFQHQSFQWTPRMDLPEDGLVGSPCSLRYP